MEMSAVQIPATIEEPVTMMTSVTVLVSPYICEHWNGHLTFSAHYESNLPDLDFGSGLSLH